MPFGSFNTKKQQAYDQRTAGSDNAQVASLGGRIFNNGGRGNPTAATSGDTAAAKLLIVGAVVVVVALVWAAVSLLTRKT